MKMLLFVAAGGAVGASGRYLAGMLAIHLSGGYWPFGTFTVNAVGSCVLGVLVAAMTFSWTPSPEVRAFLVVGLLGGFTTFSAFSLDVVLMIERGREGAAALYVGTTLAAAIGGLFAGMRLTRMVLA
ncbi:MAG: fluoride efflux transporter CrcB [Alphaproteobacteria bacterium]